MKRYLVLGVFDKDIKISLTKSLVEANHQIKEIGDQYLRERFRLDYSIWEKIDSWSVKKLKVNISDTVRGYLLEQVKDDPQATKLLAPRALPFESYYINASTGTRI